MMNKANQNNKYIYAFALALVGPSLLKMLSRIIIQKIQDYKNKSLYSVGIQINYQGYKICVCQPIFDQNKKLKALNILKQQNGQLSISPQQTITQIKNKLMNSIKEYQRIYSIGVSSVGLLQLDKNHLKYGFIKSTITKGWKDTPLIYYLSNIKSQKLDIQTYGNSAALAQFRLGTYQVRSSLAYVSVGKQVNVGIISNKSPVHGLTHPKCGHIFVNRHKEEKKDFFGVCDYHKNCLEGMVSLKSIKKRMDKKQIQIEKIEDSNEIWQMIGYYLAQLCYNLAITFSPEIIVFSGILMKKKIIYSHIRRQFINQMNKFRQKKQYNEKYIQKYIVQSSLGDDASIMGSILLQFV